MLRLRNRLMPTYEADETVRRAVVSFGFCAVNLNIRDDRTDRHKRRQQVSKPIKGAAKLDALRDASVILVGMEKLLIHTAEPLGLVTGQDDHTERRFVVCAGSLLPDSVATRIQRDTRSRIGGYRRR